MNNYRRVQFGGNPYGPSSVVKNLLIANGIIFFLQAITGNTFIYLFSLVPRLVWSQFQIWRLVTYMFLHGGLWHIVFNMYALWMFGTEIERMWGSRVFLQYYFVTGIGAGIFYTLVNAGSMIPTLGASGAIYGILVAYAVLFPNRQLMLLFPPIPMRAKTMISIFIGIELFNGIFQSNDGVAHFAHLGGALVGYLFMKNYKIWEDIENKFNAWNRRRRTKNYWEKQRRYEETRKRVDAILDKANRVGFDHLTQEEKEFLKKAGESMGDNR